MAIYYIQYEAEPGPDAEEYGSCGGAYVNCWIRARSESEAQEIASAGVLDSGWKVRTIEEECREVTVDEYDEEEEGRDYCRQAATDGECFVFHLWPIEPQEGDNVH